MKKIVLWLMRVTLVVAPVYCLYNFFEGEGANYDAAWWKANALFIAATLGTFFMLLMASFNFAITWAQLVLLLIGTAGLVVFYFSRENYMMVMEMEFFQANKKAMIIVPYVFVVVILALCSLFKRRFNANKK